MGRYTIGYGEPKCKEEELINIWINKHNERFDGLHYHKYLITGIPNKDNSMAKNSTEKYMVKIRLFHMVQHSHTIEYKVPSEYCLDNAYKIQDMPG